MEHSTDFFSYYKLSRAAEKYQESFGRMIDEGKPEEFILKAQDKMIKIKMEAQESGQTYRTQLVINWSIN